MTKHHKTRKPSDADLKGNPLIGGSRGTTAAGHKDANPREIEGENTVEGDRGNDTNIAGGTEGAGKRSSREQS